MRMTRAIVLISLMLSPAPLFAQEASRPGGVPDDVAMVIAARADVGSAPWSSKFSVRSSTLRDAIAREAARLSQTGTPDPSSPPVTSRSWVARHPVQAGFWIGAAVGTVVGLASCANAPEFAALCASAGFGSGGGAGALVGLAVAEH